MALVNQKDSGRVYNRVFFIQCLLCGAPHGPLCPPCQPLLPRNDGTLCRCALPQHWPASDSGQLCGRCLRSPPPFTASHAPLLYRWPVDQLINRYKHQRFLPAEHLFNTVIAPLPLPWPEAELLCPLPSHWRRRWWRGFDQSLRLARMLQQHWQLPLSQALQRQRHTPRQQGLDLQQRQRNLKQAFRCIAPVQGRRILLIDDVLTTGSSASTASRCLLADGAAEVQIWALARTPSRQA